MTNRNKAKGDRAERAVLLALHKLGFPWAKRTRAGYERDYGDIHLSPGPGLIAQVKDHKTVRWVPWLADLRGQRAACEADHAFLVVKRAGLGDAGDWLAVMPLRDFAILARRAGYGDPLPADDSAVPGTGETDADLVQALRNTHLPGDCRCASCLDNDQNKKHDGM